MRGHPTWYICEFDAVLCDVRGIPTWYICNLMQFCVLFDAVYLLCVVVVVRVYIWGEMVLYM